MVPEPRRRSGATVIDNVVFDLGGVLIDWDPRYLYRKLFDGDELAMERFLDEVCSPAWNSAQDGGRSFAEGCALLKASYPSQVALIDAYFARWPEMLGGPIAGSVELLQELVQAGIPLYALSNWSAETFIHAERRYDFLRYFRGIVVSGREGLLKPQAAIYRLLLERYRLVAERTLFIDDRQENVRGAQQCGLQALCYQSPGQLRQALNEIEGLSFPGHLA